MANLLSLLEHISIPNGNDLSEAQRLFHGRGHAFKDLKHVTVDWLPPVLLITLFSEEDKNDIELLTDKLLTLFPDCKSIQLQHRYLKLGPIDILRGESIDQLVIEENQLKYKIQLGKSRNTGLFLDIKNGEKLGSKKIRKKKEY